MSSTTRARRAQGRDPAQLELDFNQPDFAERFMHGVFRDLANELHTDSDFRPTLPIQIIFGAERERAVAKLRFLLKDICART